MKKTLLTFLTLLIILLSFGQGKYNKIYDLGEYRKDWALVEKHGLFGFIYSNGKEIVKPKYNKISKFGEYRENWALVEKDGLFGFIYYNGNEIIKPKYEKVFKGDIIEGLINGKREEIKH